MRQTKQCPPPLISFVRGRAISINTSTSPQATRDLMKAVVIGFAQAEVSEQGHVRGHSVTLAILILPQHIGADS